VLNKQRKIKFSQVKMNEIIHDSELNTQSSIWGRIIRIIIAYIIIVGLFQYIGLDIIGVKFDSLENIKNLSINQHLFLNFIGFVTTVLIVFLFRKSVDKKTIISMGFSITNISKDLLLGFCISLILLGLGTVFILLFTQSKIAFSLFNHNYFIKSFLLFVIVSLNEELFFRGYILNNLLTLGKKYKALILSSVIFALFHALNPNLSLLAFVNIFLAGLLLGSSYIFNQNLWFPISLHLFWNFLQGAVFGYAVSGQKLDAVFALHTSGENYLHGGEFGFEGSFICTVLVSLTVLTIFIFYSKNTATFRHTQLKTEKSVLNRN